MNTLANAMTFAALLAASAMNSLSAGAAPVGYALGDGGTTLLRFNTDAPSTVSSIAISGAAARLDAIDFRPNGGMLFGYDDRSDAYYTVNLATGVTTLASTTAPATNSTDLDIDWNPTIDRLRTVTATTQNIVYNPITQTASNTGIIPLFYAATDTNAQVAPLVVANGYTNSIAGSVSTTQYVLDHGTNSLATLANNAGVLNTVAKVTLNGSELDFGSEAGLDILFDASVSQNIAYALLAVGGSSGLYTLDLTTGAATALGALPVSFGGINGLAIAPVPEPAGIALFGFGLSMLALRRRRQA